MEINMVVEADNLVLSLKEGKEVISVMYINLKMLNNGLGLTELKNIYTKKDYRRQGLMERLMKETFEVIQEERQPLTVMVPNDEKIFKKYGFNYISDKEYCDINSHRMSPKLLEEAAVADGDFTLLVKDRGTLNVHTVKEKHYGRVSRWLNKYLDEKSPLHATVSEEKIKSIKLDLNAQDGSLFMMEYNGLIKGVFDYIPGREKGKVTRCYIEDEINDWDIFIDKYSEKYMSARVIDAAKAMTMLTSTETFVRTIRIKDNLLPENNGVYMLHTSPEGGPVHAVPIEPMQNAYGEGIAAECEIDIDYLAPFIMGYITAEDCIRVYVKSKEAEVYESWNKLLKPGNVIINI